MTLEEALALIEAQKTSITKLEAKNAEALAEKQKAKAKADEIEARIEKIEKEAKDKADTLEAEAAKKAGDWDKRETQLKAQHAADLAKVQADLDKERAARNRLVIDNAISAQLDAAGVRPEFKDASRALLRAQKAEVEINADGDFVGKLDGKPIADAVKAWAESDAGKHFIGSTNSGGGAPGSPGHQRSAGNPYDRKAPNYSEQGRLEKENPTLAKKLQAEAA